tara:strand:+ start:2379 stop:5090 length:2712 start_codon:yes stop_codon:yes gene_type:complete
MPRIPLYNQGTGPTQGLAAGQLSPRANTAAFTAPGRAFAGFQQTLSKAGKVAADFELAQQKINADTLETQLTSDLNEKFSELENKRISDVKVFESEAKNIFDELNATIDNAGRINSSLKSTLKNNFNARFSAASIGGKQNAFTRGIENQAESAVLGLKAISKSMITSPQFFEAGLNDAKNIFENLKASGADRLVNQTFDEFKSEAIKEDFAVKVRTFDTIDQVKSQLENSTTDKGLTSSQISAYQTIANAQISKISDDAFDVALTAIQKSNIPSSEIDDVIDNSFNTGKIEYNGEVIADLSQIGRENYPNLLAQLKNRANDVLAENLTNQSVLLNATDDVLTQMQLNSTSPLGLSKEEENNGNLNFLDNRLKTMDAAIGIDPSAVSVEEVDRLVAETITILDTSIGGQPSYLESGGEIRDKATTVLRSAEKLKQSVRTAVADGVEVTNYSNALTNNRGMFVKDGISSDNRVTAVNQTMAKLSDDPTKQVDVLARNNETYDAFTAVLVNGFNEALRPEYNPLEAGENDPVMQGLELYRLMEFRNEPIVSNHLSDPKARAFYETVLRLEESYPTEQAIATAKRIDLDIDISVPMKKVDEQLAKTSEEMAEKNWYAFIPFMADTKFVPENISAMKADIRDLAEIFVRTGMEATKAVEAAAKDYGKNHKRIRGMSIQITTDLPEDIEELADIAAEAAMKVIPEDAYEIDDLSIAPVSKDRTDRFIVVYSGGYPVQDKDGNFIEYEVGKPIIDEQVGFMGLQPTGIDGRQVYPGNTLRGMRDAEKLSETSIQLNRTIAITNLTKQFKTLSGPFDGLSGAEARKLFDEEKAKINNTQTIPQKIEQSLPTALEYFRQAFTLDNKILKWMSENTPGDVIIDLATKGGKAAREFAKDAEIQAAKFRKQQGIE